MVAEKKETMLKIDENASFEELLKLYDYNFKKGDLVKGKIIGFDSKGVLVDIGAKTSAIVPSREVSLNGTKSPDEVVKIGDEYEFLIIREENDDGQLTLSLKKVSIAYGWKELEKIQEKDETVEGEVFSVVKGGILVEVKGIRGFIPSSHLRLSKEAESLIGEKLDLKILSMDQQQNNLILSHRKAVSEFQTEKKKDVFEKLDVGKIVEGEIVRLADFGAFIDIGGIDGLLPLSQMSWRWVDHPSDILKVGEKVKVEIISIDHSKQRVSLSLKNLQPDPWIEAGEKIKEGEKISGTVTRLKHFGAFIEIFPCVEALLPQKEVLEYQNRSGELLEVGKTLETTVVRFNPDDRRISLSVSGEITEEDLKEAEQAMNSKNKA
jgi:small subunit ribosomal protein S1